MSSTEQLEATIATGLRRWGDRNVEWARWVLTDIPQFPDISGAELDRSQVDNDEFVAMMGAVAQADPIVEWRLRQLLTILATTGPFGTLVDVLRNTQSMPSEERLDELLAASNADERAYVRALLQAWSTSPNERELRRRPSFARFVRNHPEIVTEQLNGNVDAVGRTLVDAPADLVALFAPTIAELATASSKARRSAGSALARRAGYAAMVPDLQRLAVDGSAAARAEAIRVWADLADDEHLPEVVEFCQQHCAKDRSAAVRDAVEAVAATLIETTGGGPLAEFAVSDEGPPTDAEHIAFQRAVADAHTGPEDEWKEFVDAVWSFVTTGDDAALARRKIAMSQDAVAVFASEARPLYVFRLITALMGRLWRWGDMLAPFATRFAETGSPSLLELQAVAEHVGFERREAIKKLDRPMLWGSDATAEWVLALLPDQIAALDAEGADVWYAARYYDSFATLVPMPPELRAYVMGHAIGPRKGLRPLAREALAAQPGIVDDVIGLLSSRKDAQRVEAAEWLAELGGPDAARALHEAAATESDDAAFGAELVALEQLGESIDAYLDPDLLVERGAKELENGLPSDVAWLHVGGLPTLRWTDGTEVDPRLVEWLVVQTVRLKSSSPSPILTRLYARMEAGSVTAFANAVFAAWISEDLEPLTPGEASANASRGLLSLVAAGADATVVAPTESYLRKWFGKRFTQAKALIEMLGSIDDPSAIQLLLSIGNRFRTAGIQEAAMAQAELLAHRKGWTLEDLAFRTVPTGDFAGDGTLTIDYGDRAFVARLTDDLTVVLSDEDGKTIKSLPTPRAADDPDLAKQAKKDLTAAKKQIAAAAKEQPFRLFDAMCVQRSFALDDFDRYVLGHPVMGRLAARLVWAAVSGERRTLFRPLVDGTLLNADDEEVDISDADFVTLAHQVIDGGEVGERWRSHFADYKVTPLFAQFDRPAVPELADGQVELSQWRGTIIDDRRLRSAVGKVDFVLGDAEDAGIVPAVERRFVGADLRAELRVRGLHATILEKDVAIDSLRFTPLGEVGPIPLAEVPPVLLVETIANVEQIVAAGDGVDADWEQRVRF